MSGGFFRGTSADQDTRFSNKQAKLMKSQKFAPELEHLVDITKVSMDVMRPWIANRVTELLGFEDEVLINFIYGLLEGKVVNGKEIQISLTGFMEKNTVKFMKELWTLLISAQNNASGVPQQFLDAKQEEARKKKEEADRFASEIQRKKEKERIDQQEILKKMEEGADKKANSAALEPSTKHMSPRDSNDCYEDERGAEKRIGVKARNKVSRSPNSENSSLSPRRRLSSPDKSPVRRPREQMTHDVSSSPPRKPREQQLRRGSPDISEDKLIASPAKVRNKEEYSRNRLDNKDLRNKEQEMKSGKSSGRVVPESPDQQQAPTIYKDSLRGEMQNPDEGRKSDEKNRSHSKNSKDSDRHRKTGSVHSSIEKVDHSNRSGIVDSGSEESEKCRGGEKGKRKNKRSERQEVTSDDDYSNDSEIDERKDAKRRKKEEKRSRKEKKRRRREERRRRKEERRAGKMKGKNYSDASASDGEHVGRRELHSNDNEEKEDGQKKLEIELRKKALESLKAKKGISH
ncbi:PWI domain-containing protein C825.05c-like isoform X4 [Malus sylvestris]|uniref:PWI domain-containing protein C825.05c-like isoform X4 n=1 Tax=Malus sylvestris TaxID=3752 RepID=UPI0021ABA7CB|nr:PWI domain-containing protein C825.05c-like isoform X4 [Malus sylvestris]